MTQFNDNTPIEKYSIKNRIVFVKREDLFVNYPYPNLGKLRGLRIIIENLFSNGISIVGCWDTRVSQLGQGLAAICNNFPGMKAIISYPVKNGEPIPDSIRISETLNAEIYPIRGNHISICYSQVKKYVNGLGGYMLPFGLECSESVKAISEEAYKIPLVYLRGGTLILSCGSGVTLSGLLIGLKTMPKRIIGISSGRSSKKILACVKKYVVNISNRVEIHPPLMPYYEKSNYFCPFPSHPFYDLKAWQFLVENIESFSDPILFWNIGS